MLLLPFATWSQCPAGGIGISGGGCISGCNLTSLGGPNCSPPVTGNTTTQTVTANIVVPAGCTYTVTAVMSNRPGCTASGGDNGDGMKVDIAGGAKAFQTGTGNAALNDSYTLTGPGTIRVSCRADRQDEIVTYTTTSSGALCVGCMSSLPVELSEFTALKGADYVDLLWTTLSERDNDYFTIERSQDGVAFEAIGIMNGAGNSTSLRQYTNRDISPLEGISYYRIRQTDMDGAFTYSAIRAVTFSERIDLYPNPASETFVLRGKHLDDSEITLTNAIGQQVEARLLAEHDAVSVDVSALPEGIYFVTIAFAAGKVTQKVVIAH